MASVRVGGAGASEAELSTEANGSEALAMAAKFEASNALPELRDK